MTKESNIGEKMSLGENIRRIRIDREMTQGELGKMIEMKVASISRIERDHTDPRASTVVKIMEGLKCSANELLTNEENAPIESELKTAIERAEKLPKEDKAIIVRMIESLFQSNSVTKIMNGDIA